MAKNKSQSLIEYSLIIAVVVSALTAMSVYVRRSMQANLKLVENQINAEADRTQGTITAVAITPASGQSGSGGGSVTPTPYVEPSGQGGAETGGTGGTSGGVDGEGTPY